MKLNIYEKDYWFDDLSDLSRDLHECLDPRFNPIAGEIKQDHNGVFKGKFKVTMVYEE